MPKVRSRFLLGWGLPGFIELKLAIPTFVTASHINPLYMGFAEDGWVSRFEHPPPCGGRFPTAQPYQN
ncbi:protein of unknown function [Nitrospina watsonii]|uniref:Uncharacterized protein n=1 Tax=Nitrospina watsonii TaxID=1323948 RepID=A0ABN8W1H0_9BACT|nr:protein of unknown function [Nitrospina watsonii]